MNHKTPKHAGNQQPHKHCFYFIIFYTAVSTLSTLLMSSGFTRKNDIILHKSRSAVDTGPRPNPLCCEHWTPGYNCSQNYSRNENTGEGMYLILTKCWTWNNVACALQPICLYCTCFYVPLLCIICFINFRNQWKRQRKWHNFLMKSWL